MRAVANYMVIPGLPRFSQYERPTIHFTQQILQFVCNYREIPIEMVKSDSRKREYVITRMLFAALAIKKFFATPAMAMALINKDRTSHYHYLNAISNDIAASPEMRIQAQRLEAAINKKFGSGKNLWIREINKTLYSTA